MARLSRLVIPQQLHHVFQRGHDGKKIFLDNDDYLQFLRWLAEAARMFHVKIHAYVLLPDHWQLLVTPEDATGLGKMMQWIGRQYVPYFNRKTGRQGSLWAGRFKATVLEAQHYLLPCMLHMEGKPQQLGLVPDALDYPWSSFAHHTGGKIDPLIVDHSIYWALGNTPFQREAAYKELMRQGLSAVQAQALTQATQKSWLLGTPSFQAEMSKLTDRRVMPSKRGRPAKRQAEED
jgi:putative transposase